MPETALEPKIKAVAAELGLSGLQVSALEGGAANRSFRLRDARHDYVLAISGRCRSRPGCEPCFRARDAVAGGCGWTRPSDHSRAAL